MQLSIAQRRRAAVMVVGGVYNGNGTKDIQFTMKVDYFLYLSITQITIPFKDN